MEHEAFLDVKERYISSRAERLEATLRIMDENLKFLVQQRIKELEDKHITDLDALSVDSAAQLKKLADDLAAASIAKTDLDQ